MPLWHHFEQNQAGKGCEREKIKIIPPFHSYARREKNSKKMAKKFEKLKKYQCGLIISQNRFEKVGKERK